MKNTHKEGEGASGNGETSQVKRLLVLAAVGLKLGRTISQKLEKVEESIEILARQKARELNPDEAPEAKAK
jgi:hypothetical protein